MNNIKIIQFGDKYLAKHTEQIQIELDDNVSEPEVYQSLEDTGIEFLIHSISPLGYEFSVVYPKGIRVRLITINHKESVDSWNAIYTSLVLLRRAGTRLCIRLDECTSYEEFTRFRTTPIIVQYTEEGKFRLSGEKVWQFNRGEEYRQTIMTEPNTIPDSINALMGVIECEDPVTEIDAKRLKGQANYARFRIEEFMSVPMSSQMRDTLHSYLHTLGYFIGNLQKAKLRSRRKPVLDDLRKDYLIEHLSQLLSKSEMSTLNQKATASAIGKIKALYPDNESESITVTADSIMKQLVVWPFHTAISAIFEESVQNKLPMNPCSKCNGRSQVKSIQNSKNKGTIWTVECVKCGNTLDRNLWQGYGHGAVAIWNKANPCDNSTLNKVPFLALGDLTRKEAKEKILEVSRYMDVKNEHIKALERESTPSQRVWLNKQKSSLAYLTNLLTHARAVLAHQNNLSSGNDLNYLSDQKDNIPTPG